MVGRKWRWPISSPEHKKALSLFEKQIEYNTNEDREAQLGLYAENLHYEFPFASDRPRVIEGRETFRRVMEPLGAMPRQRGAQVVGRRYEFHATDEKDLFLATFDFEIQIAENRFTLPFVQLIRVRDDYMVSVKVYFNPVARNAAIES